jgi:hypothetical protein
MIQEEKDDEERQKKDPSTIKAPRRTTRLTVHTFQSAVMAHYMCQVAVFKQRALQRRGWMSSEFAPARACLASCLAGQPRVATASGRRRQDTTTLKHSTTNCSSQCPSSSRGLWGLQIRNRAQSAPQTRLPPSATTGFAR